MKVLFLVPYPSEGASNRVRVEQFIPYLQSKGVVARIRPFVNKRFYEILYRPHHHPAKIFWFIICTFNRLLDIVRAMNYDLIFIHREAYPLGGAFIETILHAMKKPIVYDFDDAVYLPNTSEYNIYIERLKNPDKTRKIIEMSKEIIAGNNHLKNYAVYYNRNVQVIPSSVDTEKYKPFEDIGAKKNIIIGWIGSDTTRRFLRDIEGVFEKISQRYPDVRIKVVGASLFKSRSSNVINKRWLLEEEISDLQSFDIGIMPMPDDRWTEGKCGFKAILYMACGIPVVASPVGANLEIIEDGRTGFFGKDPDDWMKKISALIENKGLREDVGRRGRESVVEKYSLKVTAPLFYETLKKAYGGGK